MRASVRIRASMSMTTTSSAPKLDAKARRGWNRSSAQASTSWALFASVSVIRSAASSLRCMVPPSGRNVTAASGRLLERQERLEFLGFLEQRAGARVERADRRGIGPACAQQALDRNAELVPELAGVAAVDDLRADLARRLVVRFGVLAERVEQDARERVAAASQIGQRVHPLLVLQEQLPLVDLRDIVVEGVHD